MAEFNAKEVQELVERALAEGVNFQPKSTIPLSFAQGSTYEALFETLTKTLHPADVQMVLDNLRINLHSGIDQGELKTLHMITKACKKCSSAENDPQLPMWNVADPDCVIIVEQPIRSKEIADVIINGLKEAGFNSNRVNLTFLNRCPNKTKEKYSLDEISNCLPYLHTEIQLLKPKIILTLGLIPTASVLGIDIKLGEVRGNIIWLGPWAILPTYSPAYVLRGSDTTGSIFQQDISNAYNFIYGAR